MIQFIHDQCRTEQMPVVGGIRVEALGRFVEAAELENGFYGISIHNYFSSVEPNKFVLREKTFHMLYAAMTRLLRGDKTGVYEVLESSYEGEHLVGLGEY